MITTVIDQLYSITIRELEQDELVGLLDLINTDGLAEPQQVSPFSIEGERGSFLMVSGLDLDTMMNISREVDHLIRARIMFAAHSGNRDLL